MGLCQKVVGGPMRRRRQRVTMRGPPRALKEVVGGRGTGRPRVSSEREAPQVMEVGAPALDGRSRPAATSAARECRRSIGSWRTTRSTWRVLRAGSKEGWNLGDEEARGGVEGTWGPPAGAPSKRGRNGTRGSEEGAALGRARRWSFLPKPPRSGRLAARLPAEFRCARRVRLDVA